MSKIKVVDKFTVKRSKWYRGKGEEHSRLLREKDEKMCCVGFLARAMGFPKKCIREVKTLKSARIGFEERTVLLMEVANGIERKDIYEYNDEEFHSESEREELLSEKFAELGIKVKFED